MFEKIYGEKSYFSSNRYSFKYAVTVDDRAFYASLKKYSSLICDVFVNEDNDVGAKRYGGFYTYREFEEKIDLIEDDGDIDTITFCFDNKCGIDRLTYFLYENFVMCSTENEDFDINRFFAELEERCETAK